MSGGNHGTRARALAIGLLLMIPVSLAAVPLSSAEGCAGFGNDCFDGAEAVANPGSAFVNTTGYGTEPDEPAACGAIGSTAWFTFQATRNATGSVDTVGSAYDTVLAVYAGQYLGRLMLMGCNDDYGSQLTSRVNFTCVAGQTYRVQLGGYDGAAGFAQLNVDACGAVAPSAPRQFAAQAGPQARQVTLSWFPPSNDGGAPIAAYVVERRITGGWEKIGETSDWQLVADANAGSLRSYRVIAVNKAGLASPASSAASATAWDFPSPPRNVVAFTSATEGWLELRWDPPTGPSGGRPFARYEIWRAQGSGEFRKVGSTTQTTYAEDAPAGASRYRVAVANTAGDLAFAPTVTATPYDTQADPGGEGDASDSYEFPTLLPSGWESQGTRAMLQPGRDAVDVFARDIVSPDNATMEVCFGAAPQSPALDVRLRLLSPDGGLVAVNKAGDGGAERVCMLGPAGTWTAGVELAGNAARAPLLAPIILLPGAVLPVTQNLASFGSGDATAVTRAMSQTTSLGGTTTFVVEFIERPCPRYPNCNQTFAEPALKFESSDEPPTALSVPEEPRMVTSRP